MVKTKYDVLVRNGKERFIVIPEKEYKALQEKLGDEADFRAIEASRKRNAGRPLIPLERVKNDLGITRSRRSKGTAD